jgi:hypothetical protein
MIGRADGLRRVVAAMPFGRDIQVGSAISSLATA